MTEENYRIIPHGVEEKRDINGRYSRIEKSADRQRGDASRRSLAETDGSIL